MQGGGTRDVFNWGPSGFGGDTGRTRARREKQDEYRKALDAQIEERRARDKSRRGSSNHTSQPVPEKALSDPVGHLMPWVNKDGIPKGPSPDNNQKSEHSSHHSQQPQPQLQYHHPQQQQTYSYGSPDNSTFYAPLPPPPVGFQTQAPTMQQPQLPPNYQAQHLYQNQFHPQQNVAYGYYPSSQPVAIPPPPNYTPLSYHTYGSPPQMPPQQHHQHPHQQPQQKQEQFAHPIPPPPAPFGSESQDAPRNSQAFDKTSLENNYNLATLDAQNHKPHESQEYENTAATQESEKVKLEEYRMTLEKQLEMKRRIEDEKLANQRKLDDMLRKRDDMIINRERQEIELERRKLIEQEEERLKRAEEAAKAIEEQTIIAKRLKEAKVEAKRKEGESMLESFPNTAEQQSPTTISKRADVVYDNTPVPTLRHRKSTDLEGKDMDMGGSGDNNMSIIGTFQSNGNHNSNNNSGAGFGKKKYVEDAGHVNQREDIQQQVKPTDIPCGSPSTVTPEAEPPKETTQQAMTPEPPRRLRGAETYRMRNAHTSIIGPNGQVQETYMYVPTSPVHMQRYKNKGTPHEKPSSANSPPMTSTPASQTSSHSSLTADYRCRTCPNCRHAFSGNLVIETKDESTETDESELLSIPQIYPDKQLQDNDREFLAKLQSFFKDESAQIKQEMIETDEEIFESENNMIPELSFDNIDDPSVLTDEPALTFRTDEKDEDHSDEDQ